MNSLSSRFLQVLVTGAVLSVGSAVANPIFITNFSFENLPVGGLTNPCGAGCSYSFNVGIPGWISSGGQGQLEPGAVPVFNSVPDGTVVAFSNGGTISQTVGPIVQLGVVYTLLVDLGKRSDTPFTSSAALLINGNTYAATGATPTSGDWSTFTATYTGLAADVGQAITIQLGASGVQGVFDNVRLDDSLRTTTPEPGVMSMFAGGLGAMVLLSRRFRRQ
jgi:hypothetical protein